MVAKSHRSSNNLTCGLRKVSGKQSEVGSVVRLSVGKCGKRNTKEQGAKKGFGLCGNVKIGHAGYRIGGRITYRKRIKW